MSDKAKVYKTVFTWGRLDLFEDISSPLCHDLVHESSENELYFSKLKLLKVISTTVKIIVSTELYFKRSEPVLAVLFLEG